MSQNNVYTKVSDVMNAPLKTIDGMATVADAIVLMRQYRHSMLIVNRRNEADEYGFVTAHAIARNVIEQNLAPERINIYEIMQKPMLTVRGDMNIRYAIRLLEQLNQSRALVMDDSEAVGIVTLYDMVIHYMDS